MWLALGIRALICFALRNLLKCMRCMEVRPHVRCVGTSRLYTRGVRPIVKVLRNRCRSVDCGQCVCRNNDADAAIGDGHPQAAARQEVCFSAEYTLCFKVLGCHVLL